MTNTFICIGGGPSLTVSDCQRARACGTVMTINSSWRAVPDCQYLYAADAGWWHRYDHEIPRGPECWTSSISAAQGYNLQYFPHPDNGPFNSGLRAIQLAINLGAARVLLLGYDCCVDEGTHWHGDHPSGLKNPDLNSTERWQAQYQRFAATVSGTEILNCSRRTALACFPLSTIENATDA